MQTPKHILSGLRKLEDFYSQDSDKYQEIENFINYLEKSDSDENDYEKIIMAVSKINELYDSYRKSNGSQNMDQLFFQVIETDPDLKKSLNYAKKYHPRMKKELNRFSYFMRKAGNFQISISDNDKFSKIRKFELVSKFRYEKHLSKNELIPKKLLPYKHLKIAHKYSMSSCSFSQKDIILARKHWKDWISKNSSFSDNTDTIFNFWYGIVLTGTYYVYVPK